LLTEVEAEAVFEQPCEREVSFSSQFLGFDEQVLGDVDGRTHDAMMIHHDVFLAREVNKRYGKRLRRPAQSRTVATALRRMAAAGRILQIEKSRDPTRRYTRAGARRGEQLRGITQQRSC